MSEAIQFVPERIELGKYPTRPIKVNQLIMFPQVRDDVNPELANIKASIAARGLINPIDVVAMDSAQLKEYVGFVNRLWGKEIDPNDYLGYEADGLFNVVVAGHTRTSAIRQLDAENQHAEYYVMSKMHETSSPEEIIGLQLDENLHSQPRQEQRAIAVVEAYQYGLEQGHWSTQKEFVEVSGNKFSKRILREALGFARLPAEARDFVFARKMSYNAAVALGQAAETIAAYTHLRLGDSPQVTDIKFHQAYKDKIGLIIAHICNTGINGTAAKKYIQGQVNQMKQQISVSESTDTEDLTLDLVLEDPGKTYLSDLERQYREEMRRMASGPYSRANSLLLLHSRLHGGEVDAKAYEIFEQALRAGQAQLGQLGVSVAAAHETAEVTL